MSVPKLRGETMTLICRDARHHRLEAEIERLQALANSYSAQILSEQAENERLRAALKPMVEHFNVGGGKVPIGKMLEDARRALEGK